MDQQKVTLAQGLRVGGAFVAAFSLVAGLIVAFVLPSRCSFLSGLELLMLSFTLVVGTISLIVGIILSRRKGGRPLGGALAQPATTDLAGSPGSHKVTAPDKFWQERQ